MAYDPASQQLVLFGGSGGSYLGDTWDWNGSTWAQLSPSTSPSARYGPTMAYDPAISSLVLFGGFTGTAQSDTWAWNGAWSKLSPATTPSARYYSTMAYDPATSQMVFFGGSPNNSTPMSDTWLIGAPSVTAVSPASGVPGGGTSVTVTGAGFSGVSGISFGSTAATQYLVNSTTSITVTSPAGALGIVDVVVTTGDGPSSTSPADKFAYEALPAVTAVNPVSSRMAGGGVVTITGTGFTNATTVMFGASLAANYTVVSSTQITTTAPAQAAGTVDVIVTTPVGTSAMTTADHFTYEAAPTVGAVSPVVGSTLGSTTVVITGTGYTGATVVDFGSGAGGFIVNSPTSRAR
jgi:hypothetical protein